MCQKLGCSRNCTEDVKKLAIQCIRVVSSLSCGKIGIFSDQEIVNFCSVEVIQIKSYFVCNWQQFKSK